MSHDWTCGTSSRIEVPPRPPDLGWAICHWFWLGDTLQGTSPYPSLRKGKASTQKYPLWDRICWFPGGISKRICLFLVHEPGCRGNNYYCIYHRFIAKVGFRVESSELDPENAIKISEDITRFIEVLIFQTAVRKFQKSCCIPVIQTIQFGIPSWEFNISLSKAFLKMSFLFPRWDMLIPWRVTCYNWWTKKNAKDPGVTEKKHWKQVTFQLEERALGSFYDPGQGETS